MILKKEAVQSSIINPKIINVCFALSGLCRIRGIHTQGVALGWYVLAPSGQVKLNLFSCHRL